MASIVPPTASLSAGLVKIHVPEIASKG